MCYTHYNDPRSLGVDGVHVGAPESYQDTLVDEQPSIIFVAQMELEYWQGLQTKKGSSLLPMANVEKSTCSLPV